jgi:hypothetical protein
MKKIYLLLSAICISALIGACSGGKSMSEVEIKKAADSIASIQIEELSLKADQDCEARMATEVKTIADSIVNANK